MSEGQPVHMKDNPKKNGVIIEQIQNCKCCELCYKHTKELEESNESS